MIRSPLPSASTMLLLCGLALAAAPAQALQWAAGVGAASLYFPAYRGSDEAQFLAVPVPTIAVWDTYWRIGREGAQLDLSDGGRLQMSLSVSGSLPANSDDVRARDGMPDLDPSLELGPALRYTADLGPRTQLRAEALVRAVVATDLRSITTAGWIANPRLSLLSETPTPRGQIDLRVSSGPLWGSRRYHGYFYDVARGFANPERPEFHAPGGYSGWRTTLSSRLLHGRLGVYGLLSWDALAGANFLASPLVERRSYLMLGLFVSWQLAGSEMPPD